VIYDFTIHFVC